MDSSEKDATMPNAVTQQRTRSGFVVIMHELPAYSGKRMAQLRHELMLSQPQFAALLGVSLQAVKAWETNRNPPPLAVQRLLYLMDVDRQNVHRLCNICHP